MNVLIRPLIKEISEQTSIFRFWGFLVLKLVIMLATLKENSLRMDKAFYGNSFHWLKQELVEVCCVSEGI